MLDYKGEGSFFAIVVNDPNPDKLKEFINPFDRFSEGNYRKLEYKWT